MLEDRLSCGVKRGPGDRKRGQLGAVISPLLQTFSALTVESYAAPRAEWPGRLVDTIYRGNSEFKNL